MTGRPGVWAELMDDDAVGACLPELAAVEAQLHLAMPSIRLRDGELARLTRRASDLGVRVFAWPLLPLEDGYWIGESNVEQASEFVRELCAWCARPGGPALCGISFDLEPDHAFAERLRKFQRLGRLLEELTAHVNPRRFEYARGVLARSVDEVKAAGLQAHCVTFPLVLDDAPGRTLLEDALDIPVSASDWDEVSVMVYQTAFANLVGSWLGERLVYSYARSARERFGERAGIDLGVVGSAGIGLEPGDRYPDPSALSVDMAAALAAGIPLSRMRVYGLQGIQERGGVKRWLANVPEARFPPDTSLARGFRAGVRALATALAVTRKSVPPGSP